jgi:hypothetical protein
MTPYFWEKSSMSKLHVEIRQIDEIQEHTNADALELAIIAGWQCVVKKGQFKAKDYVIIYIPIDTLIPRDLANRWGIDGYLDNGTRVKCAKLRKEPSYGIVINLWDEIADGYLPIAATSVVTIPEVPWPVDEETRRTYSFTNQFYYSAYGDCLNAVADYKETGKFDCGFNPYRPFNPKCTPEGVEYPGWIAKPHDTQVPTPLGRSWRVGDDVAHVYGIKKYEPQARCLGGPNRTHGPSPETGRGLIFVV